ncbi:peptide ABC transporter substrate-binding protein [Candidatus Enterococcus ikei]|uniref:Peptide ABC transporter substrate-binding protein n=1 Tax=Candidatus Enterococcus ikei TaxID=2815326 RepID=A0ABS3GX95_9ENTE|nr:peptide ABC transporter substrate-binding protein [Enterococcus sp. DIV0869a]MBO0439888.1 peptide ABC transporter substrate-binding protein [Enterococcus sp. DIV0869a]
MKKFFAISALALLFFVTGCNSAEKTGTNESKKAVVHFTEPAELLTLDTTQEEDFTSFNAQNQVLEGLYQLNKKDETIPAVAKELPEISEDKQTYTISLREDAKWSNGDSVTSKDFLYAWRRAVTPATAPSYASLFVSSIKNAAAIYQGEMKPDQLGVEAPDEHTLVVHLIKPIPYFTSLLTFETFFPINQTFAEKQGSDYGTSAKTTLYNGPFVLEGWEQNSDTWKYVKNPKYWDKENVKVGEIQTTVVKSTSTAVNLYQTDELDRVVLDGEFSKQYKNDPDFQNQNDTKMGYLRFNQGQGKLLENLDLRKAISLAIDRDTFVKNILGDGSIAATGFIPQNFVQNPKTGEDFRQESGSQQTFNKEAAKKAFDQAKKELNKDEITLVYLTKDTDTEKKTAEYLASQISEVLPGIKLEITTLPSNNLQERYLSGDYDIAFGQWMPDFKDAITFLDMFASTSGLNHVNYKNPAYDQLIKAASDTDALDEEKRWSDLLQAEHLLLAEDYTIAPIYQQQTALLQKKNISGVVKHGFGSPYSFKYIQVEEKE